MTVFEDNVTLAATTRDRFLQAETNAILHQLDVDLRGYRALWVAGYAPNLTVTAGDIARQAGARLVALISVYGGDRS